MDHHTVEELKKRVKEILPELRKLLKLKCGLIDELLDNGYVGGRLSLYERWKYKRFSRKIDNNWQAYEWIISNRILDELLKKRSLRKWTLFFDALDKSGLSHIRRYITIGNRGEVTSPEYNNWPLSKSQIRDFHSHRSAAVNLLGNGPNHLYRKVVDMMVEHGTLTLKERDAVYKVRFCHDAARRLLEIIPYKSISDIQDFIYCLNEHSPGQLLLMWFDYL